MQHVRYCTLDSNMLKHRNRPHRASDLCACQRFAEHHGLAIAAKRFRRIEYLVQTELN